MADKKFLLAAVNSKYIHSNLAVRYLKKYCEKQIKDINFMEFTINDSIHSILKKITLYTPEVIGFSCYIWNIEMILKLCSSLKKVNPKLVILLGGPEVSFDAAEILQSNPSVDYIVTGEGEAAFLELALKLESSTTCLEAISGIVYRKNGEIVQNPLTKPPVSLDDIPFPYDTMDALDNRIVYYETSRGCPYNCQYCLSSTTSGARYLSMGRVKSEIDFFISSGVKQVKLVDRTFNCSKNRCVEIIEYIKSLHCNTNFHFEIAGDIIDAAFLAAVGEAPKGMFQFEIGVQTTNEVTLEAVKRPMDIDKVKYNVSKLLGFGNSHIHLDLIAGLPYENYDSFKNSFNEVYALKPHMLQLGFLKLLKGSGLRSAAPSYNISYHEFPPYEVIATEWLKYTEVLKLKDVEQLLELYYNSGRFSNSLHYIFDKLYTDYFRFYEEFSFYWNCRGYYDAPKNLADLFSLLQEFIASNNGFSLQFNELVKLDWLLCGKNSTLPDSIKRNDHTGIKEKAQALILNGDLFKEMPQHLRAALKVNPKSIYYELFSVDVLEDPWKPEETLVFFIPAASGGRKEIMVFAVDPKNL